MRARRYIVKFLKITAIVVGAVFGLLASTYLIEDWIHWHGPLFDDSVPLLGFRALPSNEVREAIRGDFRLYSETAAIPASMRKAIATRNGQEFEMAEPGSSWSEGCTKMGPFYRMRRPALSKSFGILFYEFGGLGHGYRIDVFRFARSGDARLEWVASSSRPIDDPDLLWMALSVAEISKVSARW